MSRREALGESQESNGGRERSYLLLSLILLVWNIIATGDSLVRNGFPAPSPVSDEVIVPDLSASLPVPSETVSPRKEPLSARQKYLIGKQLDINKASVEEFNSLPGISDAMAAEIIAERERSGVFRSPSDLMRVKGIKEKRLQKILPFLKEKENN